MAQDHHLPEPGGAGRRARRARRVHFTPLDLSPGEGVSGTVWILDGPRPPLAFVGDLVFEGTHPYIADGMTSSWIDALGRAQELLDPATALYVGHGAPVGHPTSVPQDQKHYLLMLREAVHCLDGRASGLKDQDKAQLVEAMTACTGGVRMTYLLEWGSDGLAGELAKSGISALSRDLRTTAGTR